MRILERVMVFTARLDIREYPTHGGASSEASPTDRMGRAFWPCSLAASRLVSVWFSVRGCISQSKRSGAAVSCQQSARRRRAANPSADSFRTIGC